MPRNIIRKLFRLTRGQLSPLDKQQSTRRYPTIVNHIRPCPKRCLLMPVGARTESTTSYSYNARRGQFPHTRIGVVRKTMRRGFALVVLFICDCTCATGVMQAFGRVVFNTQMNSKWSKCIVYFSVCNLTLTTAYLLLSIGNKTASF